MAEFKKDPPPEVSGPAQFAARARTSPDSDVWFTIGQAWAFEDKGKAAYKVALTMMPISWDGELLLVAIPKEDDA